MRTHYRRQCLLALCWLVLCVGVASAAPLAEGAGVETVPAVLDAESIQYDENAKIAVAEGNAVLRYMDLTFTADKMVMYSDTGLVQAFVSEGKRIVIRRDSGETLDGTFLEYHLESASGFMDGARGQSKLNSGTLYISGRKTEIVTADDAYRAKWLHSKYLRKSNGDDIVNRWADTIYTTCRREKDPHYHFRSKRLISVPGKYVILHHPDIYIGKKIMFTSPFELVLNQRAKKGRLKIRPNYEDKKYLGVTASQSFGWKNGSLDLSLGYSHGGGMEYTARVDQRLTDWMSVYVGDDYLYDPDLDEVKSRPFWGATFARDDWTMEVEWAQREKRSVVKRPGEKEYETTLWRDPEIELKTPWVGLHIGDFSQYARLKANWGRFHETGSQAPDSNEFRERYGWGVEYYTDYPVSLGKLTLSPFFKGDYWNYGYKNEESDRQIISKGTVGLRASYGIWELGTAYEQQRVSGRTGLHGSWDSQSDSETLYQRLGVQLGKDVKLEVQGIIALDGRVKELTSVGYILTYDNSCCTRWCLTVNDDLTDSNNNDWISLSFEITALPDSKFELNKKSLENPFGRSGGMKKVKQTVKQTYMEKTGTEEADDKEIKLPQFENEDSEEKNTEKHNH